MHRHIHRFDDGPPPKPDLKAAAAFRHDFASPLWAQGPDPVLAPLANRYPRRNVVVLLLESQRLAEIAPHGAGAWKHRSLSPNLTALCERGLFLSNYVQSGPGTFFARFSLATGLPGLSSFTINGCPEGIDLALGGPLADFVASNYRCEWMQAADPAFSGWDRYLSRINVAGWIQGAELAHAHENKDGWTSWGMPDEQLLDIAWNRYRHHLDQPEAPPYLLAVLTVSNHSPYSFPKTAGRLPLSHDGGMQYADACLGIFVKRLLSLPEAQRPVLLITGDHSHRDDLSGATPIGPEGLEGVRIPGLLITPDAYAAGQVCTTPFVHEDALDLMLLLVGQTATDKPRKFIDAHRIAATSVNGSGMSIMSEQGFFSAQLDAAYERQGTWGLIPASKEVQQALHAAKGAIDAAMSRMWTH